MLTDIHLPAGHRLMIRDKIKLLSTAHAVVNLKCPQRQGVEGALYGPLSDRYSKFYSMFLFFNF